MPINLFKILIIYIRLALQTPVFRKEIVAQYGKEKKKLMVSTALLTLVTKLLGKSMGKLFISENKRMLIFLRLFNK